MYGLWCTHIYADLEMRFLLSSGLLVSYLTIKKISSSARDGNYRKSVLRFPWYVLKHW